MRRRSPGVVAVLALTVLASGCASQTAMDMLNSEAKLALAADRLRATKDDGANKGETPDANKAVAESELSDVEKQFRAKYANAQRLPDDEPVISQDPRSVFERARAVSVARRAEREADIAASYVETDMSPVVDEGRVVEPEDARTAWKRFLAVAKERPAAQAEPAPSGKGPRLRTTDTIKTGSVAADDRVAVRFAGENAGLEEKSEIKLKLLHAGGRVAERIAVGRVAADTPFETLSKAQALGRHVAAATGGDPVIAYDPAVPTGQAVVEFKPARAPQ